MGAFKTVQLKLELAVELSVEGPLESELVDPGLSELAWVVLVDMNLKPIAINRRDRLNVTGQ